MSDKYNSIIFSVLYIGFVVCSKMFLDASYLKLFIYIGLGIAGIFLFKKDYKESFKQWKEHPVKNLLFLIGLFFAHLILVALVTIPGQLLYPDVDSMNDTNIEGAVGTMSPVLIILAMGILGPLVEEYFFRFVLISRASSKVPAVLCVIVSAVLFTLIHLHAFTVQEIVLNLDKLAAGLLYGTALVLTKNVTVPAGVHILNNVSGLSLMILSYYLR